MKEEISLKLIIDIIKSKIIIILSATVVAIIAAVLITKFYITPKYSSYMKLTVASDIALIESSSTSTIATERNLTLYARDLMETCIEMLNTGDANIEMNEKLREINPEYENIRVSSSAMNVSQVGTTCLILVSATTSDPQLSYDACLAFEKMAAERVPTVGYIKINLADSPRKSSAPSSPNLTRNCIIGALAGFLLCSAVIILIEMLDNTVKDGEAVSRQMEILLLAEIPDIFSSKEDGRYYEYKSHGSKTSEKAASSAKKAKSGGSGNGR